MKTAREFLKDNIENSNIPEEHYEWEIAEMMEMYADYYHKQKLILCVVGVMFSKKEKKLLSFLVAKDMSALKHRVKNIQELEEWETDYRKLIGKINKG